MELIQCKVIKGKYGPQVCHEGDFYKIGSFSADRVKVGLEYEFILEEKMHAGKTIRWANLPRRPEGAEEVDESIPAAEPKKAANGLTLIQEGKNSPRARQNRKPPAIPKPRKSTAAAGAIDMKIFERIADALEGIESLLDRMVDRGEVEGD